MEDSLLTLSQESKLASEVFRHVDPLNFYENFLKEGIRPDGRKLFSYRKTTVRDLHNFSNLNPNHNDFNTNILFKRQSHHLTTFTNQQRLKLPPCNNIKNILISSILLNCGNSQYHCKLTGELKMTENTHHLLGDSKDIFSVDVVVPKHVVNEIYDLNGPCINISHLVSELIQKVLNSPDLIPKEQFCYDLLYNEDNQSLKSDKVLTYLSQSRLRWFLSLEILCDEYDGNLLDMCFLATSYCLLHSKLPFLFINNYSNQFYPILLSRNDLENNKTNQELSNLFESNKTFIFLQLLKPNLNHNLQISSIQELFGLLLSLNLNKTIQFNQLPYTFTFCRCQNYFLLDPTMEEERIGVNYSIYVLKRYKTDGNEESDDFSIQPLNLMGLTGVNDEMIQKLYDVSRLILKSM